ncbi:hypothetical protein GE061_014844 [Apolygus lucorum]|uniref:ABC transporter domain-containing protein n=1 Tax=Apolygus lucorum TaxID=248454 RepID=A0A8S9XLE2_APOLU|nr:hypothetical protein GE061_014844 [Apolygus lucorum]
MNGSSKVGTLNKLIKMSVVDLTLDDSDEATEDEIAVLKSEGEGLPPSSNCHFNQIKTAPASPANSEDSRDELYSLADSWEDPNIATIELDVNHESDSAAESDSEVILIKPELAPKDFVVDESHLADGSPKPMVTIEPDSDLDLKKVVNVGEEPVYTIPEEESDDADDLDLKKVVNVGKEPVYTIPEKESDDADDLDLKKVVNVGKEPVYTIPEEESDDADEPEFLTVEDNIIIESDSDGVESEASDYSVTDLRTYDCTFCDFSTEVEEWFHKHMDNHAPGTKPQEYLDTDTMIGDSGFRDDSGSFNGIGFSNVSKVDDELNFSGMEGVSLTFDHPSNGFALTWRDLSVSYMCHKDKFFGFVKRSFIKRIVENVSGAVPPGSLVALMGPSGAGKSSILSALARRSPGGVVVTGDVRLNGRAVDDSIRKVTGYMYQEDYFIAVLTVREHLKYMARLKMDRRTCQSERELRINTLLQVLSLTSVADSRIGGLASDGEKGILSGGEKKRLSFATACLTLPQLLFVDEPTTGLDSFTAARLVSVMKSIVLSTGASMIATIHQPSPEILAMFSSIILVAEGRMVFSGSTDEALHFFQDCGFKMSKMITEGEFLLECLANERYTNEKPSTSKPKRTVSVRKLAAMFEASKYCSAIEDTIQLYEEDQTLTSSHINYKEPFWIVKLFWLTVRGILELIRNPNVQWIRIGQKLLIALTAGVCYFGTIEMDQKGVQDVQGVLFLLVTENVFAPMYAVMAVFPKEYPQFVREYRNGAYSPSAYFLSKLFVIGPGAILEAFIFTTVLYVLAGLRYELLPYLITTSFTLLCITVATSCGALFSNAFSSIPVAMMYLLPVEYVSMVTSGIFMKLSSLPWVTSWLQYVSWFMYTYESMSIVQWSGVENITCPVEELRATCLSNGDQVLEHYDFSANHLLRNAVALVMFCGVFQIAGFYCFVRKVKREL